ncbi:MAG: ShlB/FhaC/HecB family hemolysin secretion/activation protein [Candidatus Omnitrophota bacterium]
MKKFFPTGIIGFFLAFILAFFSSQPLYPQEFNIEKATRETDRFGSDLVEEKLMPAPRKQAPLEAEPQEKRIIEEGEKFLIRKILLTGTESFSPEDFVAILLKYEGKEVTLEDLNILSRELEREYLRRGVIAAVIVPPQEIKEETVMLRVVEARMGKLHVPEHKFFNTARIYYYWWLPEGEILRYDKISKSLHLMNKNPDREVKAALVAGKKPGTTDILMTTKTSFPVHFMYTLDNEGSSSTGKTRMSMGGRHNNFLGIDDMFLSGYSFGRDFSGYYAFHNVPVNSHGASLLYGYSRSKSIPTKEFSASNVKSKAESLSMSLRQELFDKGEYIGESYIGMEAKDKTVSQLTGVSNRDRLRILRLGGNFLKRDFRGTISISPELSQGVTAFGAHSNDSSLASRGADSTFTKFTLKAQQRRLLPKNLQANLKFQAQLSSAKLAPQEEFGLGGIDSVRGYPSDDYLADNALLGSAEILIPALFMPKSLRLPYAEAPLREQATALVFFDYGHGERRGALLTEEKSVDFMGVGAGIRIRLFNQGLLRLEWGFPLGNNTITQAGHSRLHFSFDFQDKLPEEIERIRKIIEEENIKYWAWQILNQEVTRLDSPLRKKLFDYLSLAESSYKEGRLKDTREYYEMISSLGRSVYLQAEDYVRAFVNKQKELHGENRLALMRYRQGWLSDAKQVWQKIIEEGKPSPLVLEF